MIAKSTLEAHQDTFLVCVREMGALRGPQKRGGGGGRLL